MHTITFGEGPPGPPANWPVSGWGAPAGPPPWDLGSVDYDGTGFLNTGIILKRSTATVHFTAAGDFPFLCAIHPGMAGSVRQCRGVGTRALHPFYCLLHARSPASLD